MANRSRIRKDKRGRFVPVDLQLSGPAMPLTRTRRKPGELSPVLEAYLEVQRRRRVSPLTLKTFSYGLSHLQRWLDEHEIEAEQLTGLDCEHYFGQLLDRISWATTRQHLAYVRAAYGYGVRHGLVDHDPTADVKLGWPPDREPETYSNEQLRAMHAAIQTEREELAFHILAFAGLRLGEAAGLRWAQIDLGRAQMKFEGKGKKFRLVPIHPALERVLREYELRARDYVFGSTRQEGRPVTAHTIGVAVKELTERAEVTIDSPTHAFRRTVATVMYEQGVRTRVIERIMGWAPRLMHERHYLRVADESMRQAILTLYHDDPVCDHQHEPVDKPRPQPLVDLSLEIAVLEQLEQRYGVKSERPWGLPSGPGGTARPNAIMRR